MADLEALRLADLRHRDMVKGDLDRRLHEMNEFRQQLGDERSLFLDKDRYEERHAALEDRLDGKAEALSARLHAIEASLLEARATSRAHEASRRTIYAFAILVATCSSALVTLSIKALGG